MEDSTFRLKNDMKTLKIFSKIVAGEKVDLDELSRFITTIRDEGWWSGYNAGYIDGSTGHTKLIQ